MMKSLRYGMVKFLNFVISDDILFFCDKVFFTENFIRIKKKKEKIKYDMCTVQ